MFPTYNFRALIIEERVVLVFDQVTESNEKKKSKFQLQATESMRKKPKLQLRGKVEEKISPMTL